MIAITFNANVFKTVVAIIILVDAFVVAAWTSIPSSSSLRHTRRSQQSTKSTYKTAVAKRMDMGTYNENCSDTTSSLAGEYVVTTSTGPEFRWSLLPIDQVSLVDCTDRIEDNQALSDGARSLQALNAAQEATMVKPSASFSCSLPTGSSTQLIISLDLDSVNTSIDHKLIEVLQRIFVQWVIQMSILEDSLPNIEIILPRIGHKQKNTHLRMQTPFDTRGLFDDVIDTANVEMVEMVSRTGEILGEVPRTLVHEFNILHRGIGIFVTKDIPINPKMGVFPDLYVHQRTDTKRIFPSLYDMFVGGVSIAKEKPIVTARREVAEELGLNNGDEAMANALFDCIVCTAYNRCVVTLFSYTMQTEYETIKWQEEEVKWGDFVPYDVINDLANNSIHRLIARNQWPGKLQTLHVDSRDTLISNNASDVTYDIETWDFVPDGLLVWEAWLQYVTKLSQESQKT